MPIKRFWVLERIAPRIFFRILWKWNVEISNHTEICQFVKTNNKFEKYFIFLLITLKMDKWDQHDTALTPVDKASWKDYLFYSRWFSQLTIYILKDFKTMVKVLGEIFLIKLRKLRKQGVSQKYIWVLSKCSICETNNLCP
jgi:hypothetical protein